MGAQVSSEEDQGLLFIAQKLPAAAKPLDWDDLEGSAIEHALANTLKNVAMLKNNVGQTTMLQKIKPSSTKKAKCRGTHRWNVSWAVAIDSACSSSSSGNFQHLLNNDMFLALHPSVQQQSALWRDCDSRFCHDSRGFSDDATEAQSA